MILYLDRCSTDGQVHVRNRFLTTWCLSSSTVIGLYEVFERVLNFVGLEEYKAKFIGFGCDGTNVNIAEGGLKGLLTKEFPWLVVPDHELELSLKDALKGSYFDAIDELLLRLYYLYEKSP